MARLPRRSAPPVGFLPRLLGAGLFVTTLVLATRLLDARAAWVPFLLAWSVAGVLWTLPAVLRHRSQCAQRRLPLSVFWRFTAPGLVARGLGALLVGFGLALAARLVLRCSGGATALDEAAGALLLVVASLLLGVVAWRQGGTLIERAPNAALVARRGAVAWLRRRAKRRSAVVGSSPMPRRGRQRGS